MEPERQFNGGILFEVSSVFIGVALAAHFEATLQYYSLFFSMAEYLFYVFSIEALIAISTFGLLISYYACAKYFPPRSLEYLLKEVFPLFLLLFFSSIPFVLEKSQLLMELASYRIVFLNLMPILIVTSGSIFLFFVKRESAPLRNRPTEGRQFRRIVLQSAILYITVIATCGIFIVLSYVVSISALTQSSIRFVDDFLPFIRDLFGLILEVLKKIFGF